MYGIFQYTFCTLFKFWPNLHEIYNIFESTQASLIEKTSNDSKKVNQSYLQPKFEIDSICYSLIEQIFEEHLKPDIYENGIRKGALFSGKLCVNRHHPGLEAIVQVKR